VRSFGSAHNFLNNAQFASIAEHMPLCIVGLERVVVVYDLSWYYQRPHIAEHFTKPLGASLELMMAGSIPGRRNK